MNCLWRQSVQKCRRLAYIKNNVVNLPVNLVKFCSFQQSLPKTLNPAPCAFYNVVRYKSKKRDYDSDEEEFDEGDHSLSKDSKVMKITTTSLRTDAVLKLAHGVARNKIEQLFFESKIRVNGKKILKKSSPVRVDYEIDVIKGYSPKNPDHIIVSRIEVLDIVAKEESIVISVRRFKNLLIENYEKDPYKASTQSEETT
ncbi:mitochondrial transcription rescue factor 1 isoform X2 [Pieris rapae]|uniref:mitochondrial transcription rescue factor 1 isoform X2 n=1 Tax=Pieris rapae TaxID=64459 RepID=UPI001E2812D6|nr:mitochondrial transcription rescue factor 1 isoform X2 [Pieris rapae]